MNNNATAKGHPTMGKGDPSNGSSGGGPPVTPTANQLVTAWFIAPVTGNDRNNGLTAGSPIKTMAEWRRRVWGARYGSPGFPTIVTINVLESSTNPDDGLITGITTIGTAANIVLLASPIVVFSGILTASVPTAGNNRGTVADTSIPVSWTASGGISSAAGSRWIRRADGAVIADLVLDQGAKTAMIGLSTNTSSTSTGTPTVVVTNFAIGDHYDVLRHLTWPNLVTIGVKARLQNLDVSAAATVGSPTFNIRDEYVLCGFLSQQNYGEGFQAWYKCIGLAQINANGLFVPQASTQKGAILQFNGRTNMNGSENVSQNAELRSFHGSALGSFGVWHCFDNVTSCLNVVRMSKVDITADALVGSGNSGKLVTVVDGSIVTGAATVTGTTSDPLPYSVTGVAYQTPVVNDSSGDGIYL